MTQDALKRNEMVKLAESIGFIGHEENRDCRQHFYWTMRGADSINHHEFSVHQHSDGGTSYRVKEIGECGFTTAYVPDVKERLKKIAKRGAAPAQTTEGAKQ